MNASALAQARRHFKDVLAALVFLRREYLARIESVELTVLDLWKLSQAISMARASSSSERNMNRTTRFLHTSPPSQSDVRNYGAYRAARVVGARPVRNTGPGFPRRDGLFDVAERRNLFVGPTEVCAGTRLRIPSDAARVVVEAMPR